MTIQEFRDYMASGKPVIGGGDVHMMFHQLSKIMQHNILKHGFTYCGIIYLLSGDERLAYQKMVSR